VVAVSILKDFRERRLAGAGSAKAVAQLVRVLLVEDSKVLTERLSEAIRQNPEVELVGCVDTENAARELLKSERIDVMILDLHLRQGNGFGVLRALSKSPERPFVVVLTNYDLPQYKDAALALGAAHFMDKIRDYDKLPEVLHELVDKVRSRA
jgi:two-component system, OmpR family, response regulator